MRLRLFSGSSSLYTQTVTGGQKQRISAPLQTTNNESVIYLSGNFDVSHEIEDKIYLDDLLLINLTETFGVGKEPTSKIMDS